MWEWLRKLLGGGKGVTQIGKGNLANTGSTAGDNSPVFNAGRDLNLVAATPVNVSPRSIPPLSDEAKELLLAGSQDPRRTIVYDRWIGGVRIETNGRAFTRDDDPVDATRWENAMEELEDLFLVEARNPTRHFFRVNANGMRIAGLIGPANPSGA
jgi:hypothetical protein